MKAFISHINEEASTARALKDALERGLPGVAVFATSIGIGEAWLSALTRALTEAKAVLVLCSPRSVERPWVNFEGGAGWSQHARVIPICHDGLRKSELPFPLSIFQAIDIADLNAGQALLDATAQALGASVVPSFDVAALTQALQEPRFAQRSGIGIVLTHGQHAWDDSKASPFEFPASMPSELTGPWTFQPIQGHDDLLSTELHRFSGLILGMPWRARMSDRVIASLVRWVRRGGRMLMLGYELGDRHHNGNLGELAQHFGIQFQTDIVGPVAHVGDKPYGDAVKFDVASGEAHSLTTGLTSIHLANVQTLRCDPGGTAWLRVGNNVVCVPQRGSVEYRNGILGQPRRQSVDINYCADWIPVAVEAPQGLCGSGGVHAVGSWELLGKSGAFKDRADNRALLERMLEWLSGR